MADARNRYRRPSGVLPVPRLPGQVLALIGLTGGSYAISLAAVAGLQSASETALAAARAPVVDGIGRLSDGHDGLESGLSTLADLDRQAVAANDRLGAAIADLEGRLDRLSANVSAVDGAARSLPARAPMPAVRSVGVTRSTTSAHATTGGSAAP